MKPLAYTILQLLCMILQHIWPAHSASVLGIDYKAETPASSRTPSQLLASVPRHNDLTSAFSLSVAYASRVKNLFPRSAACITIPSSHLAEWSTAVFLAPLNL